MTTVNLHALARLDDRGRPHFQILENPRGELVLAGPRPVENYRPLDGVTRMRLAALAAEHPSLVVENGEGDYVVLVEEKLDPERHLPLGLDDAELLASSDVPLGRFGRRDDDVLRLTPWAADDVFAPFEPDDPGFTDVPLVTLDSDAGELVVERSELDERVATSVREHLRTVADEPGRRYGVFTNPFGEFACIPVGSPMEPHEDLRRSTVIRAESIMDGATSLAEAATALRRYADRLEAAASAGWVLPHPITEDHGFPERAHSS